MDNFKTASKLGLRFATTKGNLSTEQLWSLTQTDLTAAIKNAKKLIKKSEDDDLNFLDQDVEVSSEDQLRFDILKDVYLTKKAENEAARTARDAKEHNQKILQLIEAKKEEGLQSKSIEELEALLVKF